MIGTRPPTTILTTNRVLTAERRTISQSGLSLAQASPPYANKGRPVSQRAALEAGNANTSYAQMFGHMPNSEASGALIHGAARPSICSDMDYEMAPNLLTLRCESPRRPAAKPVRPLLSARSVR
jgi:hypothetical protein